LINEDEITSLNPKSTKNNLSLPTLFAANGVFEPKPKAKTCKNQPKNSQELSKKGPKKKHLNKTKLGHEKHVR